MTGKRREICAYKSRLAAKEIQLEGFKTYLLVAKEIKIGDDDNRANLRQR